MIIRRIIWTFLICHLSLVTCHSQTLSTENKRAERFFYTAVEAYESRQTDRALAEVNRAIREDQGFTEAYILRGDIYAGDKQPEKAIESYELAVYTNKPFSPGLWLILANTQLLIGRYRDALANFIRYTESNGIPDPKRKQAEAGMASCRFALQQIANPVPFTPVNAGDSINTEYDEYINAIATDEEWLYFTRKDPRDAQTLDQTQQFEEDFYRSRKVDSAWTRALNIGPPINTHGNEGALTISPDGKYIFFAACNRPEGLGSCDLYWSRKNGDQWSVPENLGEVVNSSQWDTQPTFSGDGKTLYFISKRPGGKGSSDIWKTELMNGTWSQPVNLGDPVNTRAEEMAPFIHPDDQTLYFSSKGHPGMGGFDLFLTRRDARGNWTEPVNLGYPINTSADEVTLVVNAKGNLAYISSDKLGGRGRQDIYSFPLYPAARPLMTTYFKGVVFDEETGKKLQAHFELIDLATAVICAESFSDPATGAFLLVLPTEKNYALNVSKEGYLFYSDNFFLAGTNPRSEPFLKNIPLKPIRVGETVVLKNIFFDTDKYTLKSESVVELQKLTDLLKKSPNLRIEICGHTDNAGTAAHNLELSLNRAKAVYDCLLQQGISSSRLTFQGYGMTRPIDTNTTEQGRANNRRTEFKVVGI